MQSDRGFQVFDGFRSYLQELGLIFSTNSLGCRPKLCARNGWLEKGCFMCRTWRGSLIIVTSMTIGFIKPVEPTEPSLKQTRFKSWNQSQCWFQIGFETLTCFWIIMPSSCFWKSTLIHHLCFAYLCHLPFWPNTSSSLMEQMWACPGWFSNFVRTPFSISDYFSHSQSRKS